MKTTAVIRINAKRTFFDLKFKSAGPVIIGSVYDFLTKIKRSGWLHNNFSGKFEGEPSIGFESRVADAPELSKLLKSLEVYCEQHQIAIRKSQLPTITAESEESIAIAKT